jgi:hypothetical protein
MKVCVHWYRGSDCETCFVHLISCSQAQHQALGAGNLCQDYWMKEEAHSGSFPPSCTKSAKFCHRRWVCHHHYGWAALSDLKSRTWCERFHWHVRYFHGEVCESNTGCGTHHIRQDKVSLTWDRTVVNSRRNGMQSIAPEVTPLWEQWWQQERNRRLLLTALFKVMNVISTMLLGDLYKWQSATRYFLLLPDISRTRTSLIK